MYANIDFSNEEENGSLSVLDRISIEDMEREDFDFAAIRESLGVVRTDYENDENDLPF